MNNCAQHSGVCERMNAAEKNIDELWKGVNAIKNWVIAGMGSLVLAVFTFVISKIL
jgi:hypothetical protein